MMDQCRWTNQKGIRCGQPASHWPAFSHGNGLLTTPRDYWTNPDEPKIFHEGTETLQKNDFNLISDNWEMRDGDSQCLWQGVSGRCMLRIGHFPEVPHKEIYLKEMKKP